MATVSSLPRTKSYTLAADSAGPFSIGYRLFDTISVNVYVDDVLQTGWTVQATFVNGYDDNATVTPPATVLSGSVVRIETWMETGRASDFVPGDPSLTGNLNIDVARAWALLGDHDRELRRTLRGTTSINPAALSKNSILTIDANGKLVSGTGTIALANLPSYASWAVLDAATGLKDGQLVIISAGALGKEEVVLIKAAGTYAADGVLVRNLTASGLQAVSTRQEYASFAEFDADPRGLISGSFSIPSLSTPGNYVSTGQNITTTGGTKAILGVNASGLYNVLAFGVTNTGVDCSAAMATAHAAMVASGNYLYLPNGSYNYSTTLTVTTDITSAAADSPVGLVGESPGGVTLVCSDASGDAIDYRYSKYVYLENIQTANGLRYMPYGAAYYGDSTLRKVFVQNVWSTATSGAPINHGMLINIPAPSSYTTPSGGPYARYPLEIVNNSGYNALMITNQSSDSSGNIITGAGDNSAVGIVDRVSGVSAPAILIDMQGTRSTWQIKNANATYQSAERQYVVQEFDNAGRIAIGCSTQNSDTVASGVHLLKLRDSYPTIALYDASNSNAKAKITNSAGVIETFDKFRTQDSVSSDAAVELRTNGAPASNTELGRLSFVNRLSSNPTGDPGAVVGVVGSNNEIKVQLLSTWGGSQTVTAEAAGTSFRPGTTNTVALGDGSHSFTDLFVQNAPTVTSDARAKVDVALLTDAEIRVAKRLRALARTYRLKDAVEKKGDNARKHFGVIAQDVISAFQAEGLDPFAYGIVCHDSWEDEWQEWDDEYKTVPAVYSKGVLDLHGGPLLLQPETRELVRKAGKRLLRRAGDQYSVRYSQLNLLLGAVT